MQVQYNGQYTTLPRSRWRFDSAHLLQRKILSNNTEFYFVLKPPSLSYLSSFFLYSIILSLIKFHLIQTKYLSFTFFENPSKFLFFGPIVRQAICGEYGLSVLDEDIGYKSTYNHKVINNDYYKTLKEKTFGKDTIEQKLKTSKLKYSLK